MNLTIIKEAEVWKSPDTDLAAWLLMHDPDCLEDIEFHGRQGWFVFPTTHIFPNSKTLSDLITDFEVGRAIGCVSQFSFRRKCVLKLLHLAIEKRLPCGR